MPICDYGRILYIIWPCRIINIIWPHISRVNNFWIREIYLHRIIYNLGQILFCPIIFLFNAEITSCTTGTIYNVIMQYDRFSFHVGINNHIIIIIEYNITCIMIWILRHTPYIMHSSVKCTSKNDSHKLLATSNPSKG